MPKHQRAATLESLRSLLLGIWLTTVFVFGAIESASSQELIERETIFDIEGGPLETALIQFSRQADVQVVLAPDLARNVVAPAVKGRLSAREALTALLKGTGLVYSAVGNTVMVTLNPQKTTASL